MRRRERETGLLGGERVVLGRGHGHALLAPDVAALAPERQLELVPHIR